MYKNVLVRRVALGTPELNTLALCFRVLSGGLGAGHRVCSLIWLSVQSCHRCKLLINMINVLAWCEDIIRNDLCEWRNDGTLF